MNTALLLIDLQNDYFPGGRMPLDGSEEAAAHAMRLLDHFRNSGFPLVHIQHISDDPAATFFLPGTSGTQIHSLLQPLPGETIFVKHHVNAFLETPLLDHLRSGSIRRLVVCGMMTHMCVDAAVRAASDLGFQMLLASDACATRALSHGGTHSPAECVQAAFLASLRAYAKVMTTDEILNEFGH